MKATVMQAFGFVVALSGCSAAVRPAEFSPIDYLIVRAPVAAQVPADNLRQAAIRQATAACRQHHQGFKLIDGDTAGPPNTSFTDGELAIQQLRDADARHYTSAGISFRCN